MPAVTPGHVAFNFPNHHYGTHQEYIEAAAAALSPEYHAIVDAGFDLQLDSPDAAMAWHCSVEGSDLADPAAHLAAGIEVLNDVLSDVPPEKLRYHVCWGNYRGPHKGPRAARDRGHRPADPREVHLRRGGQPAARARVGGVEGRRLPETRPSSSV